MTYDLAVWEGDRPADDTTAGRVFTELYNRYIDGEADEPPTERISAYVAALLDRWCDMTEDVEDSSPWSTGPLLDEASGPLTFAADLARSMGLVCFDPQQDRLRS